MRCRDDGGQECLGRNWAQGCVSLVINPALLDFLLALALWGIPAAMTSVISLENSSEPHELTRRDINNAHCRSTTVPCSFSSFMLWCQRVADLQYLKQMFNVTFMMYVIGTNRMSEQTIYRFKYNHSNHVEILWNLLYAIMSRECYNSRFSVLRPIHVTELCFFADHFTNVGRSRSTGCLCYYGQRNRQSFSLKVISSYHEVSASLQGKCTLFKTPVPPQPSLQAASIQCVLLML